MASKNVQITLPQGWRTSFLLISVIQLTLWARNSRHTVHKNVHVKPQPVSNEKERLYFKDDDDPCQKYKTCGTCTFSHYNYLSRLKSGSDCKWCSASSTCFSPSSQPDSFCQDPITNASAVIHRQYDCPLGPIPYPDQPPTLLPDWMGEMYQAGALENVRLIDLSLPGTHDSLSYDLSLTVSEDGIDSLRRIAQLLHSLSGGTIKILPGDLEEFFRMQAKTQQLTLTQQLDNGVRFLDIRIMWEADKNAWYSMHFMQSKRPAEEYLKEIRKWLDAHPYEIVVIWLSKHGSTSDTGRKQYPGVSPAQKKQFWDKYSNIFDGLMQVANKTSIFNTSVATLINTNQRVVSYVSDYLEFTQASPLAENAMFIQNAYDDGDGVFKNQTLLQSHIDYFRNATFNNAVANRIHNYTLLGMNTASPGWQVISTAKHQFLHWMKDRSVNDRTDTLSTAYLLNRKLLRGRSLKHYQPEMKDAFHVMAFLNASPLWRVASDISRQFSSWTEASTRQAKDEAIRVHGAFFKSCHGHIEIPGVDHWCPKNLMDISQLSSYYVQVAVEEAYQRSFTDDGNSSKILTAFPNAFYLDALDYDGTLRTGPQLLDGSERGNSKLGNEHAKYALIDTILAYNIRKACARRTTDSEGCDALLDRVHERRSKHRLRRWNEPNLGRHKDWPPYSFETPLKPKSIA